MHETGTAALNIQRLRLDSVRRSLSVKDVQNLSPRMKRVVLAGDELSGFLSPSPDDHIKLFFPAQDGGLEARDYTPRHFNSDLNTLWVDFVIHDGGIGSDWAERAKAGDSISIGGPRGSTVISSPGAWWLLIGDETAIPSVSRRLEEMAAGTQAVTALIVQGPSEEHAFHTSAKLTSHWVHRPLQSANDPEPMLALLSAMQLPNGPGFIWIAAEASLAKAIRSYFVDSLGHSPDWIKSSAYWTRK